MFKEYTLHFDFLTSEYSTVDKDCIFSVLHFSHSSGVLTPKETFGRMSHNSIIISKVFLDLKNDSVH